MELTTNNLEVLQSLLMLGCKVIIKNKTYYIHFDNSIYEAKNDIELFEVYERVSKLILIN